MHMQVTYVSPKNMHRRTKKLCNIDFFEYDEDIDISEGIAEVLHVHQLASPARSISPERHDYGDARLIAPLLRHSYGS